MRIFIREFVEVNLNTAPAFAVWDAFKATFCGQMIAFKSKQNKMRKALIRDLQLAVDAAKGTLGRARIDERARIKEQLALAKQSIRDFFTVEEIS